MTIYTQLTKICYNSGVFAIAFSNVYCHFRIVRREFHDFFVDVLPDKEPQENDQKLFYKKRKIFSTVNGVPYSSTTSSMFAIIKY